MTTVVQILHKVRRLSKDGKDYTLTTLLLSDGMEVETLQEFEVGDQVRVWFDPKYDKAKVVKINKEIV